MSVDTGSTPHPPRGRFFQDPPSLGDLWQGDPLLRSLLRRLLPGEVMAEAEPSLEAMATRAAGEVLALGDLAETNPPRHVAWNPWGRRIDRLEISRGWRGLQRIAAEEGLVALAYERPWGACSRIVQHALLYLFAPSAATFLCPLAMTDGAARLLEIGSDEQLRKRVLPRLVSRDPERFWTSGQWMTERSGGSDVGGTETVAVPRGEGWALFGTKWFTSAVDAQVAFTLARPQGAPEGNRGLALFYVELEDQEGRLQGIEVHRLKEKLGTRALPTAELSLAGTPARMVAGPGEGVRTIATLMNVTRVYNATGAVAGMRRAVDLARDYARRRRAFGRLLVEHPLHAETLADLEVEVAAGLVLLFRAVELQGREETGTATGDERRVLRLLTPLVKLATAKQAVAVASEALECFGGAGYVEDTGLPRLLRDAQVLAIWEGTTNVLALDALRAMEREEALQPFLQEASGRLAAVSLPDLEEATRAARGALARLGRHPLEGSGDPDLLEAGGRRFALGLARTKAATLLLEQAAWARSRGDDTAPRWLACARRWCRGDLAPLLAADPHHRQETRDLVGPVYRLQSGGVKSGEL